MAQEWHAVNGFGSNIGNPSSACLRISKDSLLNCIASYKTFQEESRHVEYNNADRPHKCGVCGKAFKQKAHLNTHVLRHNEDKPHKCAVCNKSFKVKCDLYKHTRIQHEDRRFYCRLCGKEFKSNAQVNSHAVVHLEDKPFQCTKCHKTFQKEWHLFRHVQYHDADRPHKCTLCNNAFKRKSVLKTHLLTHNVDKPFACRVCKKTFRTNFHLLVHAQTHKNECAAADETKAANCTFHCSPFICQENIGTDAQVHNENTPLESAVYNQLSLLPLNRMPGLIHSSNVNSVLSASDDLFNSMNNLEFHSESAQFRFGEKFKPIGSSETLFGLCYTDTLSIYSNDPGSIVTGEFLGHSIQRDQEFQPSKVVEISSLDFERDSRTQKRPLEGGSSSQNNLGNNDLRPETSAKSMETSNLSFWSSFPEVDNSSESIVRDEFVGHSIQRGQEFHYSKVVETNSFPFKRDTRTWGIPFGEASSSQNNFRNSALKNGIVKTGETSNHLSFWSSFPEVDTSREGELWSL